MQDVVYNLVVAVGCLDEYLRLLLGIGSLLQPVQTLGTLGRLYGQVAVEGEALSVEARSHDREDDGRRTDERNDAQSATLCQCHDIGTGVGNGGTSGFGYDTDRQTFFLQRLQVTAYGSSGSVFVQLAEGERINVHVLVHLAQEAACGAHVLDDKVLYGGYDIVVESRQHTIKRRVAKGHGDEVKGCLCHLLHFLFCCLFGAKVKGFA